jgi:hypothetical protein
MLASLVYSEPRLRQSNPSLPFLPWPSIEIKQSTFGKHQKLNTKIKHPHFDRKPSKYPYAKISQFTGTSASFLIVPLSIVLFCSSSICGLCLLHWYLQTFLSGISFIPYSLIQTCLSKKTKGVFFNCFLITCK